MNQQTDTPKDSQAVSMNALIFGQDGKPQWDLAAETVTYPVELDRGGSKVALLAIEMRNYEKADLRAALARQQYGFRRDRGKEIVLNGQDFSEFFDLFDKNFVLIVDGTNVSDRAKQLAHMDKQTNIKTRIVRDGWGGPRIAPPDEADDIDPLIQAENVPIRVEQELWNAAMKRTERVEMTHFMASPRQTWYQRAQAAQRQIPDRSGISFKTNYETIERLYDEVVVSLEGMVLNGASCDPGNSLVWIPRVPLWHKILVVTELSRETRAKN